MKKIMLLLTILYVGALNGMEKESEWEQIMYANNQKDFTRLVHILANKKKETTHAIAQKINTYTARRYIQMGEAILHAKDILIVKNVYCLWSEKCEVIKFDDVDVNYTLTMYHPQTGKPLIGSPLWNHVHEGNLLMVEFLLDNGAKVRKDSLYVFPESCSNCECDYVDNIKSLLYQARVNAI